MVVRSHRPKDLSMRSRSRALSVALVAALALVTGGCGNGDGGGEAAVSDESRPYVDALKQSMKDSNGEDDDIQFNDDQMDCIAPRFVNIIGVERLDENGVTPADLASDDSMDFSDLTLGEKEGNALYDTLGDCDVNLKEIMVASFAEDDEVTPAMAKCMEGVFTDDNLRLLMVSTLVQGDDALEEDPTLSP